MPCQRLSHQGLDHRLDNFGRILALVHVAKHERTRDERWIPIGK